MKRTFAVLGGFLVTLLVASWCKAMLERWFNTFEFDDLVNIPGLGLVYPNTLLSVAAYAVPFFAVGLLWSRISLYSKNSITWSAALGLAFLGACLLAQRQPEPIPTPSIASSAFPLVVIYWSNWWLPPFAAAAGAVLGKRLSRLQRLNAA